MGHKVYKVVELPAASLLLLWGVFFFLPPLNTSADCPLFVQDTVCLFLDCSTSCITLIYFLSSSKLAVMDNEWFTCTDHSQEQALSVNTLRLPLAVVACVEE